MSLLLAVMRSAKLSITEAIEAGCGVVSSATGVGPDDFVVE